MSSLKLFAGFDGILNSLRAKIIFWAALLVVQTVIVLVVCNVFFYTALRDNLELSSRQIVKPYAKEIEVSLKNVRYYIANQTISHQNIDNFRLAHEAGDGRERMAAMQSVINELNKDLARYPGVSSLFLMSGGGMEFIADPFLDYAVQHRAADYVRGYIMALEDGGSVFSSGFISFDVDGRRFLLLADVYGETYFGCWIDVSGLLEGTGSEEIAGLNHMFLADADGVFLSPEAGSAEAFLAKKENRKYVAVRQPLDVDGYDLVAMIDRTQVFKPLNRIWAVSVLLIVIMFVFLLAVSVYLRRKVIAPLNGLVVAIDRFRGGDFNEIKTDSRMDLELRKVYDALNSLTGEIESLKIRVYEEKLAKHTVETELFQLQIKPHFFLNTLNSILCFAREGDYDRVRRMIICLSKYFRNILYKNTFISIGEELSHTENFLEIQSLREDKKYGFSVELDEDLVDEAIPILIIQTFVENSLIHSSQGLEELEEISIKISVRKSEINGLSAIQITVSDTGSGFDEQTLGLLNRGAQKVTSEKKSIGISNIQKRLAIIYGENSNIVFSNNATGGACVQVLIPLEYQEGWSA